jgi:hypothetical protein
LCCKKKTYFCWPVPAHGPTILFLRVTAVRTGAFLRVAQPSSRHGIFPTPSFSPFAVSSEATRKTTTVSQPAMLGLRATRAARLQCPYSPTSSAQATSLAGFARQAPLLAPLAVASPPPSPAPHSRLASARPISATWGSAMSPAVHPRPSSRGEWSEGSQARFLALSVSTWIRRLGSISFTRGILLPLLLLLFASILGVIDYSMARNLPPDLHLCCVVLCTAASSAPREGKEVLVQHLLVGEKDARLLVDLEKSIASGDYSAAVNCNI